VILTLFAIAAGVPLLAAAVATASRAGFDAWSVTTRCGGHTLDIQAQLKVIA
jgi:hypothetical protein